MSTPITEQNTATISPISHANVMIHHSQSALQRVANRIVELLGEHYRDERGMSTVEYAHCQLEVLSSHSDQLRDLLQDQPRHYRTRCRSGGSRVGVSTIS